MFKVDNKSVCTSCKLKVTDTQGLKCIECECLFHAICSSAADKESQICNSTFLTAYIKPSTKENFTWMCDACKTKDETNKVATLRQLINTMSEAHTAQITTLSNLVQALSDKVDTLSVRNQPEEEPVAPGSVWADQARVQKLRIPSSLVVKPDDHGNKINSGAVRKIATEQGLPINSVVESINGETYVNLPDIETRDRVSQILEESHASNPVIKLRSKLPTIAVMSVTVRDMRNDDDQDLSAGELQQSIYRQNKSIAVLMDKGSELDVVFVRPPPRGKDYYTVVIRVSPDIRALLKRMKNKIFIGVSVHNIVDRFHVKRCNRCQGLGHYLNKCDPSKAVVCGFCAKDHESDQCDMKNRSHVNHKCINCSGAGHDASGHPAFWTKCPTYKEAQEKLMKSIAFDYSDLN
jgi:hypothetical protein